MALELEPDHPPEIRAGNGRQLHRLRDHRAPREADLQRAGPGRRPQELAPNRGRGIVVGRHAEGGDDSPGPECLPEGDHVDLSVPERESDDVAHGGTLPPGGASAGRIRGASDQRQASGTASTFPACLPDSAALPDRLASARFRAGRLPRSARRLPDSGRRLPGSAAPPPVARFRPRLPGPGLTLDDRREDAARGRRAARPGLDAERVGARLWSAAPEGRMSVGSA